jgi:abequosyltransferase
MEPKADSEFEPLLTIAIPSFNRPEQLDTLLRSIDCTSALVEVIVSEDNAPKRCEVRAVVQTYSAITAVNFRYFENASNLGFDGNIRALVEAARGKYIMFIGDDDLFIAGRLEGFLLTLGSLTDEKYVLRSYSVAHEDGRSEDFCYLPSSRRIPAGEDSVAWLFKRSVTISGFTIDRALAKELATNRLDGTLLYQVYLMAVICLNNPALYCHTPVACVTQTYRADFHMFGSAEAERSRFTPGTVTTENSVNFTNAYFDVTELIDAEYGTSLTPKVRSQLSKYSYPFLSIQRKRGRRVFLSYSKRLEREAGLGASPYFHVYKWALLLLGERACDALVGRAKALIGHTPNL